MQAWLVLMAGSSFAARVLAPAQGRRENPYAGILVRAASIRCKAWACPAR
ncbi:hypothetical protein [Lysobacter gummosus]